MQRGGGTRRYRRADIEEAIKIEGFAEGGGQVQYRRVEVEGCFRRVAAEGFAEVFSRRGTAEEEERREERTVKLREP